MAAPIARSLSRADNYTFTVVVVDVDFIDPTAKDVVQQDIKLRKHVVIIKLITL